MIGDILVGIALRFSTNGVLTMERLNAATRSANLSLERSTGLISAQTAAFNRHALAMDRVAMKYREMRALIAGGIAVGGAALIGTGIKNAAQVQLATQGAFLSTGANKSQRAAIRQMILEVSGYTAQSQVTIAKEAAIAASSGFNKPGRLLAIFPELAKAADVLQFSPKHISPLQSMPELIQLAHLFGAYTIPRAHEMADLAARIMFTQPENLKKVLTQGRYFIPEAMAMGVPMQTIMSQLLTMGQTGFLQGRGGSGIARFLEYTMSAPMLTSHLSASRKHAMQDLGMFDSKGHNKFIDKAGNFDLQGALKYLSLMRLDMAKPRFVSDIFNAFLAQAGRYILAITRPSVNEQSKQNVIAMNRLAKYGQFVDWAQQKYVFGTVIGAWQYFATNFVNIWTSVFRPALPAILKGLVALGNQFGRLASWFGKHHRAAMGVAIGAFALVAASAMYAASQLMKLNAVLDVMGASAMAQSAGKGGGALRWIQRLLFGAPFVPLARDAAGKFIAGTSSPAMRGILSPLTSKLGALTDALREFLVGHPQTLLRGAGGRFIGGSMAKRGILSGLLDVVGPILERVSLGVLGGILLKIGTKFIPVVGWVLTIITALQILVKQGPNLAWLLGVIVGWITRKLWPSVSKAFVSGAASAGMAMLRALASFWRSIVHLITHPWEIIPDVQGLVRTALGDVGSYANRLGTAYQSGYGLGGGTRVHIEVHSLNLHGTPEDQATQFLDHIAHRIPGAPWKTSGSQPGHPAMPFAYGTSH